MERTAPARKWLIALAVVLAVAGGLWLASWLPGSTDPSIVIDERGAPSRKVENGTAYDRATLDLGRVNKIILPTEAAVRRAGEAGKVQLLMAKRLSFGGHPAKAISVREVRHGMGCAVRREGDTLVVAIHGEWDSGIEGGKQVRLVAVVPDGLEVEQRPGLSKPVGAGRGWSGLSLPAEGWAAVPDMPDPDRSAGR